MAFKMKGPSLLKMVKQMREGSPMKKDGEGSIFDKYSDRRQKMREKRRARQDARAEHKGQKIIGRADRKIKKLDADQTDLNRGMKAEKIVDRTNRRLQKLQDKVKHRQRKRDAADQKRAGDYEGSKRQKKDIAKDEEFKRRDKIKK